jgi:uncharacterized protein (TIGR03118 family)
MFRTQRGISRNCRKVRPRLEVLEDRSLLSSNVLQTNLVSDLPGVAQVQDPNLVNPWGIAESSGSFFWVSDNNSGMSTLYNTPGMPQQLAVTIPAPGAAAGSATGTPTGAVFNIDLAHGSFMITDGTHTAPAVFLFATEDGTIAGWNPGVDPTGQFSGPMGASTHAVLPVDNSAGGAVYKGLAIATDSSGRTLLYASNFRSGKIDVFATDFSPVTNLGKGAFVDPSLPAGYAPFDVQELNGKIYVTYAKQNAEKHDDVAGPGHGFVDSFNLDGSGLKRLVTRGEVNSPWGLAIAPASFGTLAGSLLVGNFGDGEIHAYNADTGAALPDGELKDPDGETIKIDGLWALRVGNGGMGGDPNKVYFTAGIDHESHGLFGSLESVAPGTPEGPAEAQEVMAALDVVQLNLQTLITDITSGASATQFAQDFQTFEMSVFDFIRADVRFVVDNHTDMSGQSSHMSATHMAAHRATVAAQDVLFANLARLAGDII